MRRDGFGPSVMRIATAEEGNQQAGINEKVFWHTRSSSNSASFFRSGPTANYRLIRSGPRLRTALDGFPSPFVPARAVPELHRTSKHRPGSRSGAGGRS